MVPVRRDRRAGRRRRAASSTTRRSGRRPAAEGEPTRDDGPLFRGRVVVYDPPKVFSFTWGGELLRFELAPDGAGTLLVFTQVLSHPSVAARNGVGLARLPRRPRPPAGRAGRRRRRASTGSRSTSATSSASVPSSAAPTAAVR